MKDTAICALLLLTASLFAGCSGGDSDSDGDGVKDEFDNCPNISNPLQADYDIALGLDGGNECDDDDDNDGWTDLEESECDSNSLDGNVIPIDRDSDGYCDIIDRFPNDGSEWVDSDGDGMGDNADIFPNDPNEVFDGDGDGIGDNSDLDWDNDGIENSLDSCSRGQMNWIPTSSSDMDNDGCRDSDEDTDDDGDGYTDNYELNCATDPLDSNSVPVDTDQWNNFDGICDHLDPDDDNDGVDDEGDKFPLDACASEDYDNDGYPDTTVENCTTTLTLDLDDDNDGIIDIDDIFPLDACASEDYDNDSYPDSIIENCITNLTADLDDDNDGVNDTSDSCPLSFDMRFFGFDHLPDGESGIFGLMVHYGLGLMQMADSYDASVTPDNQIPDIDGDGCLVWEDNDDDGDGQMDGIPQNTTGEWWLYTTGDNCVLVPNPDQSDVDGDGRGDVCDDD